MNLYFGDCTSRHNPVHYCFKTKYVNILNSKSKTEKLMYDYETIWKTKILES